MACSGFLTGQSCLVDFSTFEVETFALDTMRCVHLHVHIVQYTEWLRF